LNRGCATDITEVHDMVIVEGGVLYSMLLILYLQVFIHWNGQGTQDIVNQTFVTSSIHYFWCPGGSLV